MIDQKLISSNPFTGKTNEIVPCLTQVQVEELLDQSNTSYVQWSELDISIRCEKLRAVPEYLLSHREEFAQLISKEMGKPIVQSLAEIDKCIDLCYVYLENSEQWASDVQIPSIYTESKVCFRSLGAILGIMPWNYPFWQVFRYAFPALIMGNIVWLKHAPNVCLCAQAIEDCFSTTEGVGKVFVNFPIQVDQVSTLLAHHLCAGVAFTGSTETGRVIAMQAGEKLKKCSLELGGVDPCIIAQSADLDRAVYEAAHSRLKNSGQSCIATKRLYVHEMHFDKVCSSLSVEMNKFKFGNPLDNNTDIGPLARLDLKEKYMGQINKSIDYGDKVLFKRENTESTLSIPILLIKVKDEGSPLIQEEVFGPCLAISIYHDFKEVIQWCNESQYGLGASIFTHDPWEQKFAMKSLDAGFICINKMVSSDARIPFGGIKNSGFGRELGKEGLLYFTNIKSLIIS